MNTIKECFEEVLRGNRDESRRAARRVGKLVFSSGVNDKYKDIENLVENAPVAYEKISEDWRRENFTAAVSVIYFCTTKKLNRTFFSPGFFSYYWIPMELSATRQCVCSLTNSDR